MILLHRLSKSFNPLLGRTRSRESVEQPLDCSSCRTSNHAFHKEIDGLDSDGQHRQRPTLTSRRKGHTLFCKKERKRQTQVHRCLRWTQVLALSNHSAFHRRSTQCVALLLLSSDEPMSVCAAGTNGCLDLRCCAFPPGEQVKAEWRRYPDFMARPASDSVSPLRRMSAGWISMK